MEKYGLLFESIFKRKLTDTDTISYLENITSVHPYFSIAQFFLLSLSKKNVNGYKNQVKKTAILFNNNHWLNFQLLEAGLDNNTSAVNKSDNAAYPQSFPEKIADDVLVAENKVMEQHESVTDIFSTSQREEALSQELNPAEAIQEIRTQNEIKEEESGEIEPVVINEPVTTDDTNTIDEIVLEEIKAVTINKPAPDEEISIEEVIVDEPGALNKESKTINVEDIQPDQSDETAVTTVTPATANSENVNSPVDNQLPPVKEEIKQPEALLFEPLHTSDYFASVGIKLSEEEKNDGSLGKQLKSFTEWLKTMKKVHASQLVKTSSAADVNLSAAESNIQKLAEKSNQENDVVTEAMAEVLMQQGKADKAIEILEKLSLLNPGKSVYFAAKINQLKEK